MNDQSKPDEIGIGNDAPFETYSGVPEIAEPPELKPTRVTSDSEHERKGGDTTFDAGSGSCIFTVFFSRNSIYFQYLYKMYKIRAMGLIH